MWEESAEQVKPLRTGLTTGTCATACSVAAARLLLEQARCNIVSVTLPKGKTVELQVSVSSSKAGVACASTIKNAGDDPDVTHGATVFTNVTLTREKGVFFKADKGVGKVTREGLALSVGEPAINRVPRQMIIDNLRALCEPLNYQGGFQVSIGVEQGEIIAKKTMNGRLGIIGGLSILGTTGIVRPFSCAAWIASIHQGIDVAKANGVQHIAASTGNSSEQAIKAKYHLADIALIEMGDFAGAVLKHLRKTPIATVSICGGFGKITKLANGHMDLNSRVSSIDFKHISEVAKLVGANKQLQDKIQKANTTIEALTFCDQERVPLARAMCVRALEFVHSIVPPSIGVEVLAINRQGEFVGGASDPSAGFH